MQRKAKLSDYFALVIVALFFIWGFANINSCADAIINEGESHVEGSIPMLAPIVPIDEDRRRIWEAIRNEARYYVVNPEYFHIVADGTINDNGDGTLTAETCATGKNRQSEEDWTYVQAIVRKLSDGGYEVLSVKFVGKEGEREWERWAR